MKTESPSCLKKSNDSTVLSGTRSEKSTNSTDRSERDNRGTVSSTRRRSAPMSLVSGSFLSSTRASNAESLSMIIVLLSCRRKSSDWTEFWEAKSTKTNSLEASSRTTSWKSALTSRVRYQAMRRGSGGSLGRKNSWVEGCQSMRTESHWCRRKYRG